ncbi:MAG: peptidyl-prolyl cis-trans isomerase [Elusimicrobiales bacterium]|nr:peptidyl-prolyl cis-trans isomerase [Elusimicrobiales bacterium]
MAMPAQSAIVKPNKTVMATVNGKNITAGDITIRLWGENGTKALNEIIIERVLLDEAAKLKITVPDETVNAFYRQSLGGRSEEEANKELARIGWSDKDIKQRIKNQIIINEAIIRLGNINITDEDIKNAYDGAKEQFVTKETYSISQIAVATKAEAENILDSLLKDRNSDFAAVSAEKSSDARLRASKGLIGNIARGQISKELEDEIFALRPGQISKIMQVGTIYSIFKVNSINPSRQLSLEEVQGNIRNALMAQKLNEKKNEITQELIRKAEIKIK